VDETSPRQRLLESAIEYVAANGMSDVSLRTLASALGTSHRMLIFHFGSKEGLWVEIIRAVEQRQRELLGEILPDPRQPLGEAMRGWWRHISDPSLWPNERLFFEVYGQALQGRPHTTDLLHGIVEDWLDPITAINVSIGVPEPLARSHARLGIAVTRGLLLDLLATRDTEGVNAAMEAFIDVYETWLRRASGAGQVAAAEHDESDEGGNDPDGEHHERGDDAERLGGDESDVRERRRVDQPSRHAR
jgi:AcrR family transcriptional regulator